MVNLITSLGWIINKKKSELTSVQVFCFMGYQQHLDTGLVRPTEDRWLKLCQLIQIIDVLNWIVGLHRKDGSRREPPHEALSMASQGILEDSSVTGLAPSLVHVDSSEMVAQSSKCPKMIKAPPKRPQHLVLYRCLKRRLGRLLRSRQCQQLVDYSRIKTLHQCTRTESRLPSTETFPISVPIYVDSYSHRQHYREW